MFATFGLSVSEKKTEAMLMLVQDISEVALLLYDTEYDI